MCVCAKREIGCVRGSESSEIMVQLREICRLSSVIYKREYIIISANKYPKEYKYSSIYFAVH